MDALDGAAEGFGGVGAQGVGGCAADGVVEDEDFGGVGTGGVILVWSLVFL